MIKIIEYTLLIFSNYNVFIKTKINDNIQFS